MVPRLDLSRPLGMHPSVAAWIVWLGTFCVVIVLVLTRLVHSISYDIYSAAGERWIARAPLYETGEVEGFQYFPQAAMFFALFTNFGWSLGGVLWRALGWGLLATGTLRLSASMAPERRTETFLVATCLSVGPAIGALGNGQANLLLAALALHIGADVIEQRWWRASLLVVFGVMIKPHMAVLMLLLWALYRPMTWRVPIVVLPMAFAPWFLAEHGYVATQYSDWLAKLSVGARPELLFEDLRGLLATIGWVMPHGAAMAARLAAALGTLIACAVTCKRIREPYATAFVVAFAAVYLMVFNPRTQSTTYAIPGAIVAILAAAYFIEGRRRAFLMMLAFQIAWTLNYNYLPPIRLWLKPLAAIACAVFLLTQVLKPVRKWAPLRDTESA